MTLNQVIIENKNFWKLLYRNFVVSFHYLSDFVNNSVAFKSYHLAKEEERFENAMSATNE